MIGEKEIVEELGRGKEQLIVWYKRLPDLILPVSLIAIGAFLVPITSALIFTLINKPEANE